MMVSVACIQTNAGPDRDPNLARIEAMLREARQRGAQFIALPENVDRMVLGRDHLFAQAFFEENHPSIAFFASMAREIGAWILAGSIAVLIDAGKLANRSYVFNAEGAIVARYDKIHLFDADLSANETYRESERFCGGNRAIATDTPWGKIGLTICYDVRFPHLYRALAKAGANIITVPAAFTASTGKLHWHVLLRARAIETGCFIIAPAQCGEHDGGRRTYGHSLIVAPTGEIIAEAGDEPCVIMAELDLDKVTETRRMLPCLQHDRVFEHH